MSFMNFALASKFNIYSKRFTKNIAPTVVGAFSTLVKLRLKLYFWSLIVIVSLGCAAFSLYYNAKGWQ